MGFEELNADVHTFDHIEKVRLEDERLPGVIEQTGRVLKLEEILQGCPNGPL